MLITRRVNTGVRVPTDGGRVALVPDDVLSNERVSLGYLLIACPGGSVRVPTGRWLVGLVCDREEELIDVTGGPEY